MVACARTPSNVRARDTITYFWLFENAGSLIFLTKKLIYYS